MENSVEAAMSKKKIETIDISNTAEEAAKKMRDSNIGALFVVDKSKDERKPIGVITERDLVKRVCAEGISSRDLGIERLMSSPIATIEKRATIGSAASIMSTDKVRHLLVLDDGAHRLPVGVISSTDLARYLKANMDVNEVNARILEALMGDEEPPQV